jgi:hypothetical protein
MQGRQFYSSLKPQQAWPHGNILLHDFAIRSTHSFDLQTSLNAGSIDKGACERTTKQNLHFLAYL